MRRTKEEAARTREAVLTAAAQIIAHSGVGAFTIDAVAHEAGVTKAGVLHHFPSKEALIDGLIDQVIGGFDTRVQAELAAEPDGKPGRWLRAYLRTVFFMPFEDKNLIPALAAAVASDHKTLNRIRQSIEVSYQAAIHDGIDPLQATIVRLAIDGIVYSRALDLDVLDKHTIQKVYDELVRLTGST